jgi:histidyl-tRNA synthetase
VQAEAAADVELLAFADQLLKELGIGDWAILKLNTLGDPRPATPGARPCSNISARSPRRSSATTAATGLTRNPLRILDSKAHQDWPVVDSAPAIDDFLTTQARTSSRRLPPASIAAGRERGTRARLVRGLDYYRHTAFEFITDRLGAQGTVLAGGRYDGLIETLGGPHTPAVGWAAGIERLAMMIDAPEERKRRSSH